MLKSFHLAPHRSVPSQFNDADRIAVLRAFHKVPEDPKARSAVAQYLAAVKAYARRHPSVTPAYAGKIAVEIILQMRLSKLLDRL